MPKMTKRFTDEQIERANRVDVVEYARSTGLEIQKSGQWYKAKHMGGLYFNKSANTWHWETQDCGGTGAISLCMKLEDLEWKDAVRRLLGEEMAAIRHSEEWVPIEEPKRDFTLPDKADNYRHVYAYLCKTRGIEKSIVDQVVKQGLLYENTQKSCVFVGKDAEGNPRHASVRSTNTQGKVFKQDVPGSQKQYSFSISGKSGVLNVFEAPIDVLSYMSFQKIHGLETNDSYIALGGVTDKALEYYLSTHDNIKQIRVCSDHDEAGEGCAARIYNRYKEEYKVTRHRPNHKDFNEDLVHYRQQEQIRDHPIQSQPKPYFEKGTNIELVICDSVEEIQAYKEFETGYFLKRYGDHYESNSSFAVYSSIDQVKKILADNPNIKMVNVALSRTEAHSRIAQEIRQACGDCSFSNSRPYATTNQQDLKKLPEIEAAYKTESSMEMNDRLDAAIDRVMEQAQSVEPDLELVM